MNDPDEPTPTRPDAGTPSGAHLAGAAAAAPGLVTACSACAGAGSAALVGGALGWLTSAMIAVAGIVLGAALLVGHRKAVAAASRSRAAGTAVRAAGTYLVVALVAAPIVRTFLAAAGGGETLP